MVRKKITLNKAIPFDTIKEMLNLIYKEESLSILFWHIQPTEMVAICKDIETASSSLDLYIYYVIPKAKDFAILNKYKQYIIKKEDLNSLQFSFDYLPFFNHIK